MAVFRIEKTRNYTVMSNYHLKDKSLTLKSKGLLSLILSLPDEWNYTTRGLAAICREGVDSIGAALRELEVAGYLERNQLRDDNGRISDTEYVIYESPRGRPGGDPNKGEPQTPYPYTPSPYTENPYMDEPDTEKPAQYITNTNKVKRESNTDSLNTHQSILYEQKSCPQGKASLMDSMDEMESFNEYREVIKGNIEYDCLCERYSREMLDEAVEIMLDAICVKRDNIRIGGADYPAEIVKARLLSLTSEHIEYVIGCIKDNTTKVRNIKAYMLTTLYNAPATIGSFYTTLVNHHMAHGFTKE